jgi:thiol-disulfide isomerase/thioredoxin
MKSNRASRLAVLAALVAGVCASNAAEVTLKVGDPAPKLQQGKYIQGDPVAGFQKGTAYVVEFWATWCGPCRQSIPHLNEKYLSYKNKGLVVIGQDCWENDESLVAPFVKQMGDKMQYRVALDDKTGSDKGKMAETWMDAAGQNGIPTAFVVDTNGIIAWIGHPMTLEAKTLDSVLAGTFDVKQAAAAAAEELKNRAQFMAGNKAQAVASETKALSLAPEQVKAQLQASLDSYKSGNAPKLPENPAQ